MGPVQISPNIKRHKVFIDASGNEVKPFTKEIIAPVEKPYVPTPAEIAALSAKKGGEEHLKKEEIFNPAITPVKKVGRPSKKEVTGETTGLSAVINKAVEKKLEGAIVKALENIDLESIINKAVENILK